LPEHVERKNPSPDIGLRGYVAGVLDCDGSIWVARNARSNGAVRHSLHIAVSNTRRGLPHWFAETFWGSVRVSPSRGEKWCSEKKWEAQGERAVVVLRFALPYLVIKREQAILGLEFASTIGERGGPLPAAFKEHRERIYHAMQELNKRGPR
jgi:hypothetical protein